MTLNELLSELGSETVTIIQMAAGCPSVQACMLLSSDQSDFSSEYLYYYNGGSVPAIPAGKRAAILVRDEHSAPKAYLGAKNITLLAPGARVTAEEVYNRIQILLTEDPLLVRSSQRLMDALFSDLGLQYIVDAAFEMTGHPIYVVDNSYQYLATPNRGTPEEIGSAVLIEENKLGFIVDDGVKYIKEVRLDETVRKSQRPYYFKNAHLGGGTLLDIVKIHNVEVGHIMMFEAGKPFTRLDRIILARLAKITSLELQKKSFFKNNRGVMYSYFLADILERGVASYKSANQRLQVLGFTLKEQLYVMVVDTVSGKLKNETHLEVVADQLHWILVGSMYVIYSNRLVMLISRTNTGITEYEYAKAEAYLSENSLVAGVSNCFGNIADIQKNYRMALTAMEIGDRIAGKAINHYKDASIFHMISICETQENLINFCSVKLLALLKYDKEHKTDFTRTLYQYLRCSQNSHKTAVSLNIHKNTLLYRIERSKKIADISLDGGEELMELMVSFNILRYLKQI